MKRTIACLLLATVSSLSVAGLAPIESSPVPGAEWLVAKQTTEEPPPLGHPPRSGIGSEEARSGCIKGGCIGAGTCAAIGLTVLAVGMSQPTAEVAGLGIAIAGIGLFVVAGALVGAGAGCLIGAYACESSQNLTPTLAVYPQRIGSDSTALAVDLRLINARF